MKIVVAHTPATRVTLSSQRRGLPTTPKAAGHFSLQPTTMRMSTEQTDPQLPDPATCEWPRSCEWPPQNQRQPIHRTMLTELRIALGLEERMAPIDDGDLPPDVEQLALFSDAPETSPNPPETWWEKIWRYQGPGL